MERKASPSDIRDEDWGFVAPYLTLMANETSHTHYERLPETLIGWHFLSFAILLAKPVIETMLIVHKTRYCYNYLMPNLEFQEAFHACYPFRRR